MQLYDPDLAVGTKLERILTQVGSERMRQDILKAEGRFRYVLSDPEPSNEFRLACVMEEVGEVAKEVLSITGTVETPGDIGKLRKELIQTAALCVAWLERYA